MREVRARDKIESFLERAETDLDLDASEVQMDGGRVPVEAVGDKQSPLNLEDRDRRHPVPNFGVSLDRELIEPIAEVEVGFQDQLVDRYLANVHPNPLRRLTQVELFPGARGSFPGLPNNPACPTIGTKVMNRASNSTKTSAPNPITTTMPNTRVVLTGASGRLGSRLLERLSATGLEVHSWLRPGSRQQGIERTSFIDLASTDALIEAELDRIGPSIVIHLAAISGQADVLDNPERAHRVNADSTRRIADWCIRNETRLVFTSTDMVFSGEKPWWAETDPPCPILAYGRTKAMGEALVLKNPLGLVLRLSLLFGFSPPGKESFFDTAVADLRVGRSRTFFLDEYRTPLDYATAARLIVALALNHDLRGVIHVGGRERMSRYQLMAMAADALGLDARLVIPGCRSDLAGPEPRPADLSLATSLLESILPNLRHNSIEEAILADRAS